VSHTFSLAALGINVPIAPSARTTSRSTPGVRARVSGTASSRVGPRQMGMVARWPRRPVTWRAH
jgi:hypothetical protein